MRKLRIYLDTSFISYLFAEDTPLKMDDTLQLWGDIIDGKYEVFLSDITLEELDKCDEPKHTRLYKKLAEINSVLIIQNDETKDLANKYLKQGILPRASKYDGLHIASAVIADCDMVVSWNFKHLVNVRTNDGVRFINKLNNYKEIQIVSPSMLIKNPKL